MRYFFDSLLRIIYWIIRRPNLSIRIMQDEPKDETDNLKFEIENRSDTKTSLMPVIKITFWHPQKWAFVRGSSAYDVRELDRLLPPFQARIMTATARRLPNGYTFSWFRTYTFNPSRGPSKTVRIRNAFLEPIGWFSFTYELLKFRLTGDVKDYGPTSIDDYNEIKRSQGPH